MGCPLSPEMASKTCARSSPMSVLPAADHPPSRRNSPPCGAHRMLTAKAMIITEVERLRWRIWNGKAKNAQISIDRIHALLPSFESAPARKLRRALDAVDRYLHSQSAHLSDYAERHRAGLRVGTALTEGTANFLVNRP